MSWRWLLVACVLGAATPAAAESCTRSRQYILDGLAGPLVAPAASYQDLFKVCTETLALINVKDAYVLRDGGVAVVPKNSALTATAGTLSEFCRRFPRSTARFLTPREMSKRPTVGLVVGLSSTGATSCKKIRGVADR